MSQTDIGDLLQHAGDFRRFIRWRDIVRHALDSLGGEASFAELTDAIEQLVPAAWRHRYWEARVLRIVRKDSEIEKVAKDTWRLRTKSSRVKQEAA